MRLREAWHDSRVSWHRWWRDTHEHAAQSAEDDVARYISWPDDDAEWDYPNATSYGEVGRLRKVSQSERLKARKHTDRLHALLDRRLDRLVG